FRTIVPRRAMPSSFVIAIAQTPDGDVWLGTRDSGLLRVRQQRVIPITKGLPDQKVNSLLASEDGELWIGTDNGVVRWDGRDVTAAGVPASLDRLGALAMIRDRESNLWIGSASGALLRVNARGVSSLDERDQDPRGTITSVFEDRDGNVWIGTTRGIERLRDGVFTTFSAAQGLPSGTLGPVYADADRTWIAPARGGLYWIRDGRVGSGPQAGVGVARA